MRKSILLVIFTLVSFANYAQTNYGHYSLYIYSFTRYVIWPEQYNTGDFEILVMGDTPIMDGLKDMAAKKKVGERTIKVTKISSAAEIRKCNILFIPSSKSSMINDVVSKVNNQSILIITEDPGLATKGSNINFIIKEGKLAFEINQAAVTKQNLKIANELSRLAILI